MHRQKRPRARPRVTKRNIRRNAGIIKRNQQLYENHGVDELIGDINTFQKQREALENEFLLKNKVFIK